jgi:hypothetical protein
VRQIAVSSLGDGDEHNTYDEVVPTCLHYTIEWKVTVNGKQLSKDTEQDLALAPISYWHMFLKPSLRSFSAGKVAQNRHVQCDDTTINVSVIDRSYRDLAKRFDDTDIDWTIVEKQLINWGELFRSGKRLRIDLSFNYVDIYLKVTPAIK